MQEKTFFESDGVKVTTARFIVDSKTFAMSSVNSVKVDKKDVTPSGSEFTAVGVVALFFLFGSLFSFSIDDNEGAIFVLVPSAVITAFCLYRLNAIKKVFEYSIVLTTSSGETAALKSRDYDSIQKVEQALVDSIVARG